MDAWTGLGRSLGLSLGLEIIGEAAIMPLENTVGTVKYVVGRDGRVSWIDGEHRGLMWR